MACELRSTASTRSGLFATGSMIPLSAPASTARTMNASLRSRRFGQPEADVAETAGEVDLRPVALPQQAEGVEAVVAVLPVDGDREDERVDVDALERDSPPERVLDHPARVRDSLRRRRPACPDSPAAVTIDGATGLCGEVERVARARARRS